MNEGAENYGEMKYNELKALAAARGLNSSGTKEELIARLGEADGGDTGVDTKTSAPVPPPVTQETTSVTPKPLSPTQDRAEQAKADREYMTDVQKMKKHLEAQPKVMIMIPFEAGEKPETAKHIKFSVRLNGYLMEVPRGVRVEVPQQVAEVIWERLESEGRIGQEWRVDRDANRSAALS
jgi:hypothetical protein